MVFEEETVFYISLLLPRHLKEVSYESFVTLDVRHDLFLPFLNANPV